MAIECDMRMTAGVYVNDMEDRVNKKVEEDPEMADPPNNRERGDEEEVYGVDLRSRV